VVVVVVVVVAAAAAVVVVVVVVVVAAAAVVAVVVVVVGSSGGGCVRVTERAVVVKGGSVGVGGAREHKERDVAARAAARPRDVRAEQSGVQRACVRSRVRCIASQQSNDSACVRSRVRCIARAPVVHLIQVSAVWANDELVRQVNVARALAGVHPPKSSEARVEQAVDGDLRPATQSVPRAQWALGTAWLRGRAWCAREGTVCVSQSSDMRP
jgi:hypothetical protein